MKTLNVVGAILVKDNKVLCAQRGEGKYEYVSKKYEFPGGKIEEGETARQALHRELVEEMKLDIDADTMRYFYTVEHQYPDFFLRMQCFICPMSGEPVLTEHLDVQWRGLDTIRELDWAPADIPVVEELMTRGFDD